MKTSSTVTSNISGLDFVPLIKTVSTEVVEFSASRAEASHPAMLGGFQGSIGRTDEIHSVTLAGGANESGLSPREIDAFYFGFLTAVAFFVLVVIFGFLFNKLLIFLEKIGILSFEPVNLVRKVKLGEESGDRTPDEKAENKRAKPSWIKKIIQRLFNVHDDSCSVVVGGSGRNATSGWAIFLFLCEARDLVNRGLCGIVRRPKIASLKPEIKVREQSTTIIQGVV